MTWDIYNLEAPYQSFEIAGYLFTRVDSYEGQIELIFRKAGEQIPDNGGWRDFPDEVLGENVITFHASWDGDDDEPNATIYKDGKRIHDILLLMSLWWGKIIFTSERPSAVSPIYYGDKYIVRFNDLLEAIEITIKSIPNHQEAINKKIYPIIFLLIESYQSEIREIQTLTISPIFDLIAVDATQPKSDEFTPEEKKAIKDKRKKINKLLNDKGSHKLFNEVYNPAISSLGNMGKKMADKLYWFLSSTHALDCIGIPLKILKSQAIAFNKIRNAVVHGNILPDDIILEFADRPMFKITKTTNYDDLEMTTIFMTLAFRDIVYLHLAKELGIKSEIGEHQFRETIKEYFFQGTYNGFDWLDST